VIIFAIGKVCAKKTCFPPFFGTDLAQTFPARYDIRTAPEGREVGSREVVWIDSREVFLRALPSDSNITYSSRGRDKLICNNFY
jgi:hypothetical protein